MKKKLNAVAFCPLYHLISAILIIFKIVKKLSVAHVCIGNCDDNFKVITKQRKGKFLSISGETAIDNGNNEIRSGGVERNAGGDEKQLIKFAWPNKIRVVHM